MLLFEFGEFISTSYHFPYSLPEHFITRGVTEFNVERNVLSGMTDLSTSLEVTYYALHMFLYSVQTVMRLSQIVKETSVCSLCESVICGYLERLSMIGNIYGVCHPCS